MWYIGKKEGWIGGVAGSDQLIILVLDQMGALMTFLCFFFVRPFFAGKGTPKASKQSF
jgi:hypothetical protein